MERPASPLVVELGARFFVLLIVGGLFSLGIASLAVWLISLRYPKVIDRDGITTRGGARHDWQGLQSLIPLQSDGFRLEFQSGAVLMLPQFLSNPFAVLDYVQRCGVDTGVNMRSSRR